MALKCSQYNQTGTISSKLSVSLVEGQKRQSPFSFCFPRHPNSSRAVVVVAAAEAVAPLPVLKQYPWPKQSTAEIHSRTAQWQSALAIVNGQITALNPPLQVLEFQHWEEEDLGRRPLHQDRTRVAYQGVPGAYSELAVHRMFPGCESVPCDQFETVFEALEGWVTDRAVLPIENSLGGSIHRNYDLLLRHHNLHIIGEVLLPVRHCLLALPGVALSEIRRVISHPQALAQCENTLTTMGLRHNVSREGVDDTAGAAQFIAETGLWDTAAIASAGAAQIYGMNILANDIQDDPNNVTRFAVVGREPLLPRTDRPFKTSIVFSLAEEGGRGTGGLSRVLGGLAFRGINVTKIESRPQRGKPLRVAPHSQSSGSGGVKEYSYFEYLFYLDFEGSMADRKVESGMRNIEEYTSFLRILGSYPMDMLPFPSINLK